MSLKQISTLSWRISSEDLRNFSSLQASLWMPTVWLLWWSIVTLMEFPRQSWCALNTVWMKRNSKLFCLFKKKENPLRAARFLPKYLQQIVLLPAYTHTHHSFISSHNLFSLNPQFFFLFVTVIMIKVYVFFLWHIWLFLHLSASCRKNTHTQLLSCNEEENWLKLLRKKYIFSFCININNNGFRLTNKVVDEEDGWRREIESLVDGGKKSLKFKSIFITKSGTIKKKKETKITTFSI